MRLLTFALADADLVDFLAPRFLISPFSWGQMLSPDTTVVSTGR